MGPALALVELASIARGHRVADAMCKRAPVGLVRADWVSPGKYLVLVEGEVAAVDEAFTVGVDVAGNQLLDRLILQQPHAEIWPALAGEANAKAGVESLGVVETKTVAATVRGADAAAKGARVRIVEMQLGRGIGGKSKPPSKRPSACSTRRWCTRPSSFRPRMRTCPRSCADRSPSRRRVRAGYSLRRNFWGPRPNFLIQRQTAARCLPSSRDTSATFPS